MRLQQEKTETAPAVTLSEETLAILSAARNAVPIDTSGWFAYGVLDFERNETSVRVAYYNAEVYDVYRYIKTDSIWIKGQQLNGEKFKTLVKTRNEDDDNSIHTYTKAIARIYSIEGLRDTWYIPGNQQSNGTWNIERQYVTDLPRQAVFYEGTEIDSQTGEIHTIDWVGPWEWTRFAWPSGTDDSNDKNTFTEIQDDNSGFWHPAQQIKATYQHIIDQLQTPTTPNLSSPSNNALTFSSVTYSWSASSGTGTITYQLQVDNNSNFSSPFYDQSGLSGTSKHITGHAAGTQYYWRVRASNEAGSSAWSNVRTHTVNPATPSVSGSIQSSNPKLTWSAAAGATSYETVSYTHLTLPTMCVV